MGLDSVELLIQVEEEFQITFTDEEAAQIFTVGELRDAIVRKSALPTATPEHVYQRLCDILVQELGVRPPIAPESRIVRDLGID